MKITLPYPHPYLNPNSKKHWAVKSKYQKASKNIANYCTLEVLNMSDKASYQKKETLILTVDFYPPDRRRRDQDNMIASMKHAFDGIALALGVDDSIFRFKFDVKEHEVGKSGKVEITINKNRKGNKMIKITSKLDKKNDEMKLEFSDAFKALDTIYKMDFLQDTIGDLSVEYDKLFLLNEDGTPIKKE